MSPSQKRNRKFWKCVKQDIKQLRRTGSPVIVDNLSFEAWWLHRREVMTDRRIIVSAGTISICHELWVSYEWNHRILRRGHLRSVFYGTREEHHATLPCM